MPVFPPWELGFRTKIYRKAWSRHLNFRLIWFLQWQLFAGMKLTLHKSQVHIQRVIQWYTLAVHSCSFLCLQRRVAKVACGLFYCWCLLRNNAVATNLQRFTLNYGSRRFVEWDQGWEIGQFMANFEKFGHFLTALAMKKRIWPFFRFVTLNILSFCIFGRSSFMSLIVTVTP